MKKIEIEIDSGSGFCFGVTTAIKKAEEVLSSVLQTPPLQGRSGGVSSSPITHHPSPILHCLGDIVHNSKEVERLHECGLVTINHEQLAELHDAKVLLRAHGEPPSTYEIARRNNIEIIDATCPVVLQLQRRIKRQYDSSPEAQIVIFGKNGHAGHMEFPKGLDDANGNLSSIGNQHLMYSTAVHGLNNDTAKIQKKGNLLQIAFPILHRL